MFVCGVGMTLYAVELRQLRDGRKIGKQVCVKNKEVDSIWKTVEAMRTSAGGKAKPHSPKLINPPSSVQGVWTPSFARRVQREHNLFVEPPPKWFDPHLEEEIVNTIVDEDDDVINSVFGDRISFDSISDLPEAAKPIIDKAKERLLRKRQDIVRRKAPHRVPIYPPEDDGKDEE